MTPTELDAEWRAAWLKRADARENALRATGPNETTQVEQSRRADYDTARRFVRAACCCTTNHAQVITDYQSQEHTS